MKLQSLRFEFETLHMKDIKPMQGYLFKVAGLVNQMKSYGKVINSKTIIRRVLRSLNSTFFYQIPPTNQKYP